MARVRMKVPISGTRNGVEWPPTGGVLDVPDGEAADLVAADLAELVKEPKPKTPVSHEPDAGVERAVAADDVTVEKRTEPEKRAAHHKPAAPVTTESFPAGHKRP